MRTADAFPSKYLASSDAPITDTIQYVKNDELQGDDGKTFKPVMYLTRSKPMILNRTNWNKLAFALGDESDNWAGAQVKIASELVTFKGKTMNGLRIQAAHHPRNSTVETQPARTFPAKPATPVDPDDELPF